MIKLTIEHGENRMTVEYENESDFCNFLKAAEAFTRECGLDAFFQSVSKTITEIDVRPR